MVLDRASGKTRGLTEDFDRTVSHVNWTPDSRTLYSSIEDAGTLRVFQISASGGAPRPITKNPSFSALALSTKGKPTAVALYAELHRTAHTRPPGTRLGQVHAALDVQRREAEAARLRQGRERHLQGRAQRRHPDVGGLSAGIRSVEEVSGVHAPARRPAQRHSGCRAVALERARIRQLGLHRYVAQLPRLRVGSDRRSRTRSIRNGCRCRTKTRSRPRTG